MKHIIIMAMIFFAALLVLGAIAILVFIITDKKKQSGAKNSYGECMKNAFSESHNVIISLETVRDEFPEKSLEKATIDAALDYLENSLFRDYAGAFRIIEEDFQDEEISALHSAIIDEVRRFRTLQIGTTANPIE